MKQEIITPIHAHRRPMKGVASGIPEAIKIRSLDHVRPAFVIDRFELLNGNRLVHEMDKHGRHHRISFHHGVDNRVTNGVWTRLNRGCFFTHLGRTYIAYHQNLFHGKIKDADLLSRQLKCPVETLAKAC